MPETPRSADQAYARADAIHTEVIQAVAATLGGADPRQWARACEALHTLTAEDFSLIDATDVMREYAESLEMPALAALADELDALVAEVLDAAESGEEDEA